MSLDARFVTPREGGPAIQSGDRVRLVEEIGLRSRRAASGLRSMGVGEGDCIALLLRNDFAFFEATAAAEQLGAYPVPINWHSTAEEVRYILDDCGAKVLVAHRDLLAAIADAVPPVVTVLTVETPAELLAAYRVAAPARTPEHPLWDGWLSRHAALDAAPHVGNSAVIYTSGTTGKPKGVKRMPDTHGTMTRAAATGYGLLLEGAKVVLINGPMYHSAPNSYARFAMAVGASIVLQPRFDAEQLLAMIEQHRVTHMHIVPTMFVRLLRLPDAVKRRYELSSLRFVVHGAAPCPSEIKRAMIDWWGPVIHEYYGSTETGLVAGHNSKEALDRPGTVGRPFDMVTLRILDDTGRVLAAGETGDIYVRSADAPVFDYIGRTDERREIEREGFITVGDVGYQDADGYLFLCDRKRDMIISGGVNIYPAEIEAALHALPEVRDCAVFGIPDAEFGEAVCACVQPVEGAAIDVDLLRTALAARLSRFKIPRVIDLVDTLPREDSGKIFKRKLRERYSPRA
ncbi:MAG: acyl-CoA synthetase [Sphingomonadales bacterium]